jgi:arylsulfatase A-like enzyme
MAVCKGKILLWIISLGALLNLAGCSQQGDPQQVILILLDAARPDRFSCYGYARATTPHLDELAERGWIFKNHFTQGTSTRRALPTMLFSRYFAQPIFPGSPSLPLTDPSDLFRRPDDACISLPRLLAQEGFLTAVITAHLWIKAGTRFAAEFDELHDLGSILETGEAYPSAEQVVDYTINWIKKHRNQDFFLYIHMMDTHFPHEFGDDAQAFYGPEPYHGTRFDHWGRPRRLKEPLTTAERRYLDALYDGSLRYNDRHLGRLTDYLAATGRLDETLILITADHGEHLLEKAGHFEHSGPGYEVVGRIPLIISCPAKITPQEVSSLTEGIDVMPTILSLLNVPLPLGKSTDGMDLASLIAGTVTPREQVFIGRSVRDQRYKCLFIPENDILLAEPTRPLSEIKGRLYDLAEDPGETRDLWATQPERVQAMFDTYRDTMLPYYRRFQDARSQETPTVPFAIATRNFEIRGDCETVREGRLDNACDEPYHASPWLRSQHWAKYWLFAQPQAPACDIGFAVPNGYYLLAANLMGTCDLQVAGSDTVLTVRGDPFDPTLFKRCQQVQIGPISIEGERFQATVSPHDDGGCLLIRSFGFTPFGGDDADAELDAKRLEQLRALGYVD